MGIACVLTGSSLTLRNVLNGDLNMVTLEWYEEIGLQPTNRFRHLRGQQSMLEILDALPQEEEVGVMAFGLELQFLSGRTLRPLRWYAINGLWNAEHLPRWLLVTDHIGHRVHLANPAAYTWMEDHCELEAKAGVYRLYRVVGEYPPDPNVFQLDHRAPRPR